MIIIKANNALKSIPKINILEIPEDLAPEDFENVDDTVAATEPVLFDELIISILRNNKIEEEIESDDNDGDDTIQANKLGKTNSNSNKECNWNNYGLQFFCWVGRNLRVEY